MSADAPTLLVTGDVPREQLEEKSAARSELGSIEQDGKRPHPPRQQRVEVQLVSEARDNARNWARSATAKGGITRTRANRSVARKKKLVVLHLDRTDRGEQRLY